MALTSDTLTLRQAAALLGVPPAQLKRWFLQSVGPKAIGSPYDLDRLTYRKSDLDAWKQERQRNG